MKIYNYRGQEMEVIGFLENETPNEYILCRIEEEDMLNMRGEDWCGGLVLLDRHNDTIVPVNAKTKKVAKRLREAEQAYEEIKKEFNDLWLEYCDSLDTDN